MYILSQNGTVLLKGDRVTSFEIEKRAGEAVWMINAYTPQDKVHLGEFKNRPLADEVLDELALAVTGTTCRIFRMPPDTEEEN